MIDADERAAMEATVRAAIDSAASAEKDIDAILAQVGWLEMLSDEPDDAIAIVFRALGGDEMVHRALSNLPGGAAGAVLAVMLAMFLLGFVMDAFEIIFVVIPIVAPTLLTMPGVDPVWLGIMMAVNLQTSYMHPPLGPTLFFLRGVAPPQITTRHIYVGIIPFVLIQLFALVVLWFAPGLATALPHSLYGH